jgi:hypothetical protein
MKKMIGTIFLLQSIMMCTEEFPLSVGKFSPPTSELIRVLKEGRDRVGEGNVGFCSAGNVYVYKAKDSEERSSSVPLPRKASGVVRISSKNPKNGIRIGGFSPAAQRQEKTATQKK